MNYKLLETMSVSVLVNYFKPEKVPEMGIYLVKTSVYLLLPTPKTRIVWLE